MELDLPLIVSAALNILLGVLAAVLAKRGHDLARLIGEYLQGANKKLSLVLLLISDFLAAYQDKVITKQESEKLINDLKRIIEDP